MDNESTLWEDFLSVTEGVVMVGVAILTIAKALEYEQVVKYIPGDK